MAEASLNEEPRRKFKAVVLGDSSCGKTCVVRRLVNDYFPKGDTSSASHVGIQCHYKAMMLRGTPILLEVWDNPRDRLETATIRAIHASDAADDSVPIGAAIICDVSKGAINVGAILQRKAELEAEWSHMPIILLANKVDERTMSNNDTESMDRVCREHDFEAWFPTSAKNGQNIQMAFSFLAVKMLDAASLSTPGRIDTTIDFCACS